MNEDNSSCFFYAEIDKLIPNFLWKWKEPIKAKNNLEEEQGVRFTLLDPKLTTK